MERERGVCVCGSSSRMESCGQLASSCRQCHHGRSETVGHRTLLTPGGGGGGGLHGRRASVSAAHTLTFALLPSPAPNFPLSSLAARPPNEPAGSASPHSRPGLSALVLASRERSGL